MDRQSLGEGGEERVLRGAFWTLRLSTPLARTASSAARPTVTSASGFVAPGRNFTLYAFPFYALLSARMVQWVQGEALRKF